MSTSLTVIDRELTARLPMFAQLLPPSVTPARLMRTVLMSIERLPSLLECSPQSIMNAATTAAVLGLEVDGVTGQGYLIPFKGRAVFVVGYKGFNTLGARAGYTITGDVYREGDEFEYEKGTQAFVRHKPHGSSGRIIGAWAVAMRNGFPPIVEVMPIEDILAIKGKSPGAKKSDSPWNDTTGPGFAAMCSKTVKRRLARSMPLSVMQLAATIDGMTEGGDPSWLDEKGHMHTVVDITPVAEPATPISDTSPVEILTPANKFSWPKHRKFIEWMTWSTNEYLPNATADEAAAWKEHYAGPLAATKQRAEDGQDKEAFDAMMDAYDDRMKVQP